MSVYDANHAVAPENIAYMFERAEPMSHTEIVSQPDISPLNEPAPRNIFRMFVTELVSHPDISPLNEPAS